MKNLLLLLMVAVMATGLANAQSFVMNDFESGDAWEDWGGTITRTIVSNPDNSGINSSANALEVVTGEVDRAIKKWYGNPFVPSPFHSEVVLHVRVEQTSSITLYFDNSMSGATGGDVATETVSTTGEWVEVRFDVSALAAYDYQQIAFKIDAVGTYYFDNITLVPAQTAENLNYGNFEDGTSSWQCPYKGSVSVAANPSSDVNNSSVNVLKLETTDSWAAIQRQTLGGLYSSDHILLSFDVYPTETGQIEIGLFGSLSGADDVQTWIDVTAGSWQNLELDLSALAADDYTDLTIKYSQNATCYFDNFTIPPDVANSIRAESYLLKEDVIVYPNPAGEVVYLNRDEIVAKISIVSISGQTVKVVKEVNPANGISLTDVPDGLYVINIHSIGGGVSNFRFVKK